VIMTVDGVLADLQEAVPEFVLDPEWQRDNLTYLAFGDFARFICSESEVLQYVHTDVEAQQFSKVSPSLAFLERALRDGDPEVRNLVAECVETIESCDWIEALRKHYGSRLQSIGMRSFSGQ
jgi:hypothetical protein